MIRVQNLTFAYHRHPPVLHDVSFAMERGEIVSILGPNGCGKSTLLKAILGLLPLSNGAVCIDDVPVASLSRKELAKKLAYVPQQHTGVYHYTALDMTLMGRTGDNPWRRYSEKDYSNARQALERVGMGHLAAHSYLRLSGGERQLVLIARALAQGSGFMVMDEPVSGLDYGNQFRLLETITSLRREGVTIILTSHNPEQTILLGGRAIFLQQGRLVTDGPASDITTERVCALYNLSPSTLRQAGIHIGEGLCKTYNQ